MIKTGQAICVICKPMGEGVEEEEEERGVLRSRGRREIFLSD